MLNIHIIIYLVAGFAGLCTLFFIPRLLGVVYIPHTQIGVIEKLWSTKGSLREGQIIARTGEAGFQCKILRGGIHFGLYSWQYRVHKQPLVPERLFISGSNGDGKGESLNSSLVSQLLSLLVSEKSNIGIATEGVDTSALQAVANQYASVSAAGPITPTGNGGGARTSAATQR